MNSNVRVIIVIGIYFLIIYCLCKIKKMSKKETHLSQNSYHNFTKFIDENNITFEDSHFEEKLFKIKTKIKEGKRNIKEIAEETGCTIEECILKIKYLQNKRQLTQFHIDHVAKELIECTPEELKLIKTYTPFIYANHFTIDEITTKKRKSMAQNYDILREKVYNDLKYLVDNDLINGIRINEVDKEIIYYSLEKKKVKDLITITCPNCGALNDVNRGDKVRCEYCETILEDNNIDEENNA